MYLSVLEQRWKGHSMDGISLDAAINSSNNSLPIQSELDYRFHLD